MVLLLYSVHGSLVVMEHNTQCTLLHAGMQINTQHIMQVTFICNTTTIEMY